MSANFPDFTVRCIRVEIIDGDPETYEVEFDRGPHTTNTFDITADKEEALKFKIGATYRLSFEEDTGDGR